MASHRKKSDDNGRMPLAKISGHNNKNINVPETIDIHHFIKQHPFLATLLRKDGVLFECDGEAPSPSKDYGQLSITLNQVYYLIRNSF